MSHLNRMDNINSSMMQGMHHAHHKLSASDLTSGIFAQLDPTGQGSIDSQSFLAVLNSQTQQAQSPITSDDVSKFFTAMDSNADGKVTQQEMSSMFQQVSDQFHTRMQMQQTAANSSTDAFAVSPSSDDKKGDHAVDAMMKALQSSNSVMAEHSRASSSALMSSGSSLDQLQKQLFSMMRRYEQMGASSSTSAAANSVSIAA